LTNDNKNTDTEETKNESEIRLVVESGAGCPSSNFWKILFFTLKLSKSL
jgi:hypothetical protein